MFEPNCPFTPKLPLKALAAFVWPLIVKATAPTLPLKVLIVFGLASSKLSTNDNKFQQKVNLLEVMMEEEAAK